jgi:hypothetical protein
MELIGIKALLYSANEMMQHALKWPDIFSLWRSGEGLDFGILVF